MISFLNFHQDQHTWIPVRKLVRRARVSRRLTSSRTPERSQGPALALSPADWPGMVEGAIGWRPAQSNPPQEASPVRKLPHGEAARRADRLSPPPGVANTLARVPGPQSLLETSRATRRQSGATTRQPGAAVTSGLR